VLYLLRGAAGAVPGGKIVNNPTKMERDRSGVKHRPRRPAGRTGRIRQRSALCRYPG